MISHRPKGVCVSPSGGSLVVALAFLSVANYSNASFPAERVAKQFQSRAKRVAKKFSLTTFEAVRDKLSPGGVKLWAGQPSRLPAFSGLLYLS